MTTRPRHLVQLTGNDAYDLPDDVREEIYDWARRNGLSIPDREHPIEAITVDPEGRETHLFVTELERDHTSDYISHVRRVRLVEPLPEHLVTYFAPVPDAGVIESFRVDQGGVYGGLPEHLEARLRPEETA